MLLQNELPVSEEINIAKLDISKFRVPGSPVYDKTNVTESVGAEKEEWAEEPDKAAFCVLSDTERNS